MGSTCATKCVHKDDARGIKAARTRPCDDHPHMRRASYSQLQKLLGVGQLGVLEPYAILHQLGILNDDGLLQRLSLQAAFKDHAW